MDELPATAAYNVIAQTARDAKWESLDKQFIGVADAMRDELLAERQRLLEASIQRGKDGDEFYHRALKAEAEVERLRDELARRDAEVKDYYGQPIATLAEVKRLRWMLDEYDKLAVVLTAVPSTADLARRYEQRKEDDDGSA